MANLRAGLVGLGMMGRHHARNLQQLAGVDFVGVADAQGDPNGVAQGAPVFSTLDELLALELDYCCVAVPTNLHADFAVQLADAGVHALIEKPLAASSEEATTIVDTFEKAGLIAGVGHIERFNAAIQNLRRMLDEGVLGQIFQVMTRRQGPFPARIADVGVVKDLGSHDFDLTAWVTRSAYKSVGAVTTTQSGRPHEDMVSVSATLDNGVIASNIVNWLNPVKERTTIVIGEKGMLIADTLTADLTFCANGRIDVEWEDIAGFRGVREGDIIRYAIAKPEPLKTEHEAFRDAVLGKESNFVTAREGREVVRVCEAVIAAARTNSVITL